MRPNFEDWAQSKGFNLERGPDDRYPHQRVVSFHPYKDPLTQAAWEGYQEASVECQCNWQPRYETAMKFVFKDGVRIEEFEEELKRRQEQWAKLFPKEEIRKQKE